MINSFLVIKEQGKCTREAFEKDIFSISEMTSSMSRLCCSTLHNMCPTFNDSIVGEADVGVRVPMAGVIPEEEIIPNLKIKLKI